MMSAPSGPATRQASRKRVREHQDYDDNANQRKDDHVTIT
jgi:hypothetical protein